MTAEALQKKKKCPIIETLNDSFTVNCSLLETVDIEQPHFSRIPQLFTLVHSGASRPDGISECEVPYEDRQSRAHWPLTTVGWREQLIGQGLNI